MRPVRKRSGGRYCPRNAKAGFLWEAIMSVHKLKDGRWIVQYRDQADRRKFKREYFGRGRSGYYEARQRQKQLERTRLRSYNFVEKKVCDCLIIELKNKYDSKQMKSEVTTKGGRIDILTPKEIIEVKNVKRWKDGIGQLMVYNTYFLDKNIRLHLFGKPKKKALSTILNKCNELNIRLSWDGSH